MNDADHFVVLLDGESTPTPRLHNAVRGARTIAADGGIRHAAALDLAPKLWVGDFDSADDALRRGFAHVARQQHPAAKNETDGEIALRIALDRGAGRITIVGAFGGPRIDHALGTITLAVALAHRAAIVLTDGRQWGYPLLGGATLTVPDSPKATLSIIALTSLAGLSIAGVRWPLTGADIPFGSSRTLSNEVTESGKAEIGLRDGMALVVVTPSR